MKKTENIDVLLIHMPVGIHFTPSLGLSLLKSAVKKKGYSSIIKYYSLKFTKLIGVKINSLLLGGFNELLGDWLFSGTLFDNLRPDEEYIEVIINSQKDRVEERYDPNRSLSDMDFLLLGIKSKTEQFINSCLEDIISIKPKIVGFTSSFQQNIASLSLAKRVKKNLPETIIVFGGANCESPMGIEIIKKFPFVDIVVSGEADETFPELVANIINKEDYSHIPGVICQQNLHLLSNEVNNSPMVTNIDTLPIPDYDDYFEQMSTYGINSQSTYAYLPFESSRGCWWGEKSHCTFCGFNGNTMLHRSKSSSRLLDELKCLKDKYKAHWFEAVDNILDLSYFKDFIPTLIKENLNLNLFYEVKANLTKDQIKLLKEAKFRAIQPGIESLSTHVLDLMKKGVKSIQNVQLLKWCTEFGLFVKWGIICGFPGETNQDYLDMASLIPKITHLNIPGGIYRHSMHRFSPNFNFPEKFGFTKIYPFPSYKYIYPFDEESLYNLAYQFAYEYEKDDNVDFALDATNNEIDKWKLNSQDSGLFFVDQKDALVVFDLRPIAEKPYTILYGKERFLYLLCDQIQPFTKIKKEYSQHFNHKENDTEINELLDSLIDKNMMIRENNSYLSLAIQLGNYSPNELVMKKLIMVLKNQPEGDNQVSITNNNELLIQLN